MILIVLTIILTIIAVLGNVIASLYLQRTRKYNKATSAYLRRDVEEGDRLYAAAKKFARFLP